MIEIDMGKASSRYYFLGLGSVAIGTGNLLGIPALTFEHCKTEKKLGSKVKNSDLIGDQCGIFFNSRSDIENLISRLKQLKKEYPDAANTSAVGHSDEFGKAPRPGKKSGVRAGGTNKRSGPGGTRKQATGRTKRN